MLDDRTPKAITSYLTSGSVIGSTCDNDSGNNKGNLSRILAMTTTHPQRTCAKAPKQLWCRSYRNAYPKDSDPFLVRDHKPPEHLEKRHRCVGSLRLFPGLINCAQHETKLAQTLIAKAMIANGSDKHFELLASITLMMLMATSCFHVIAATTILKTANTTCKNATGPVGSFDFLRAQIESQTPDKLSGNLNGPSLLINPFKSLRYTVDAGLPHLSAPPYDLPTTNADNLSIMFNRELDEPEEHLLSRNEKSTTGATTTTSSLHRHRNDTPTNFRGPYSSIPVVLGSPFDGAASNQTSASKLIHERRQLRRDSDLSPKVITLMKLTGKLSSCQERHRRSSSPSLSSSQGSLRDLYDSFNSPLKSNERQSKVQPTTKERALNSVAAGGAVKYSDGGFAGKTIKKKAKKMLKKARKKVKKMRKKLKKKLRKSKHKTHHQAHTLIHSSHHG